MNETFQNIYECYRSQYETSKTIAGTVVLNYLFQVLKWAGHATWDLYAPVPL